MVISSTDENAAGAWHLAGVLAGSAPVTGSDRNVEIDVIEYYGQFTSAYRTALHVWYKDTAKTRGTGEKITVPDGSLVQDYHTSGSTCRRRSSPSFLMASRFGANLLRPSLTARCTRSLISLSAAAGPSIRRRTPPRSSSTTSTYTDGTLARRVAARQDHLNRADRTRSGEHCEENGSIP